jgi:hypothetical protein
MNQVFKSKGVRFIITGWTFFIAENVILSHNKNEIIDNFGEVNYYRLYNLLSTCACGGLAYSWYFYGGKKGPIMFQKLNNVSNGLGFTLQSIGLIGLSQFAPPFQIPVSLISEDKEQTSVSSKNVPVPLLSLNLRCPIDLKSYREGKNKDENSVYGIERVSRHAALWSIGILFLGSAASSIYLTDIAMGACPIIFSVIGTFHQDYRRKYLGHLPKLTKEIEEKTSNIPFVALLTGRQSWQSLHEEMKWTNAGIAMSLAALLALRRIK